MTTKDLDLSAQAIRRDLAAAASAIGVTITTTEEQHATPSARVSRVRTHHLALSGATPIRARFVKQGWAEVAKKLFVKEVEIGERAFDDAVYIATDTQDEVRALLGHPRAREAIVALVGQDCIVDVGERELIVTHPDAYADPDAEIAEGLALAAHLAP